MDTIKENKNISPLSILRRITFYLNSQRRKDIKIVFFLSLLGSIAESISIALLIPFISFFVNPESYLFNAIFQNFFSILDISKEKDILTTVSFIFIIIVLLSSLIKLKFLKYSNILSENITSDFRIKIFKFLINQDFNYYTKHGSNEIMSNLSQKTGSMTGMIFSSLNIMNAVLISLAVIVILIVNEPYYTTLIIISIIVFFFLIFKIKSISVFKKGKIVNQNENSMIDIFQNAVGYFPEIIIYNIRNFFLTTLSRLSKEIAHTSSEVRTISFSPRIYLETFILIFVILLIYFSDFRERSIELNISYLAILVFGAQKILPAINSIYNLSIQFRALTPRVENILKILDGGDNSEIKDKEHTLLEFKQRILFQNVFFKYNEKSANILDKLNFEIIKGQKVVVKGQTGKGKTTLINILSGLLLPTEGQIYIDDTLINHKNIKNWQKNLAIVPQTVFLNDVTILENIAIAVNKSSIDLERVRNCAKIAQINKFIETLPKQFEEKVGEKGIRLSGGQKQRLGIARALYREAKVIILDEPTNALDLETEKKVIDSIINMDKNITIVMISHSDNSLNYFDKIIDLDNNN